MSLGQNIAYARKIKGKSQEEMAAYLNVSRQSVSLWENDQTTPTLDKLKEISSYLSVSLDQLNSTSPIESKKDEVTNLNVNPKEKNKSTLLYINIFSAVFGVCLWMAPVISFLINIFSIVMSAINIKLNKEKFLPIALLIVSIVFCVASIVGTYI